MNRLTTSTYELEAITSANSNNLVVYLQQGETYYIDVFFWNSILSSGTYYIRYYNKLNSLSTILIHIRK